MHTDIALKLLDEQSNQMNQLVKNKNKFTPVCPVGANNHVDNENEKMLEDTVIKSNSNPESMNS